MVRNTTLVEPSYEFIQNEITDNSILFIDEFDATKETIQKVIIQRALDSQDDYIKLFEQIYKTMQVHEFPNNMLRPYMDYARESKAMITFESLLKEAKVLYDQFNLRFSFKTVSGRIDRRQSFLFNDSSYHTMLRNNCNYIRVTPDEEEQQVKIYFENKEEYYSNRSTEDIVLYSLIRSINSYLNRFKIMVMNWAVKYAENVNLSREQDEDEFFLENAMKSIYREFALSQKQIQLLMGEMCNTSSSKNEKRRDIPDLSFYNTGFKYFEFIDGDDHLSQTIFNYVQIEDTPEKILLFMCNKAKVIGISATATLPSVIANYDLEYLKRELGGKYKVPSVEKYQNLENELKIRWNAYEEQKVKVFVDVINKNKSGISLKERLIQIFQDRDYAKKYENLLMLKSVGDKYIYSRYCDLFEMISAFIRTPEIKSLLCLNMVLPASNKASFDLEIFIEVLSDIEELEEIPEKQKACIVVLRSDNFEVEKEEVLNRLENGEKILIMSSYQTIGAGQNLQYKIPEGEDYINIYHTGFENDSRMLMKDMDAMFLGNITNIVANAYDKENFGKKEMLEYFFDAEYLYQNDEISFSILNKLIKLGFQSYSSNMGYELKADSDMRKSKSVRNQATRDVIQAVGRLSRTYNKKEKVYIFTTMELISGLEVSSINEKLISPEMKAIIAVRNSVGQIYTPEDEHELNKAERISSQGKNYIMRMLSRNWNRRSIMLWKQLRDVVLSYPTASADNYATNEVINTLYIKDLSEKAKYLFAQKGDFSDVVIDYKNDRTLFSLSTRCEGRNISEVSEEEVRIKNIMLYPGMKDYFIQNGWAIGFEPSDYIMSPVLYQNIYKGALGEVAGSFILKKELGIELHEIDNPEFYEFFDFTVADGVYVDFKHWKMNYPEDREIKKTEVRQKLEAVSGKRAYIINIFSEVGYDYHKQNDGRVVEIPGLLYEDGTVNKNTIQYLRGEILHDME
jgi:hypothetical protein